MAKKFRVNMTVMALMSGSYEVEAESEEEAERIAAEHTGDVLWKYEGADDSTVEATMTQEISNGR